MGDGDLRLFFLSVFYQISSLTASDWPRFFKIGFNRQVEEGIMGNWSMRRRMMEPLWMTANQEPTVSPTNRRISAWCAAGRQEKPRRHSPAPVSYTHLDVYKRQAMSCMEAFACGLVPVIADSPRSATPQFALDERSLFPAGDTEMCIRDRPHHGDAGALRGPDHGGV